MGAEALEAAVFNWAQKRGVDLESLGVDIHADEQTRRPHRLQVLLARASRTSAARSRS